MNLDVILSASYMRIYQSHPNGLQYETWVDWQNLLYNCVFTLWSLYELLSYCQYPLFRCVHIMFEEYCDAILSGRNFAHVLEEPGASIFRAAYCMMLHLWRSLFFIVSALLSYLSFTSWCNGDFIFRCWHFCFFCHSCWLIVLAMSNCAWNAHVTRRYW